MKTFSIHVYDSSKPRNLVYVFGGIEASNLSNFLLNFEALKKNYSECYIIIYQETCNPYNPSSWHTSIFSASDSQKELEFINKLKPIMHDFGKDKDEFENSPGIDAQEVNLESEKLLCELKKLRDKLETKIHKKVVEEYPLAAMCGDLPYIYRDELIKNYGLDELKNIINNYDKEEV